MMNQFVVWTLFQLVGGVCILVELYSPWSSLIEVVNLTGHLISALSQLSFSPASLTLSIVAGGTVASHRALQLTTSHRLRNLSRYSCCRAYMHVGADRRTRTPSCSAFFLFPVGGSAAPVS